MIRFRMGGAVLAAVGLVSAAQADELFRVSGSVSDVGPNGAPVAQNFDVSFSKAKDVINFVQETDFRALVPIYRDDISAVAGTIYFRGVPINVAFPQNSAKLTFAIPSINESHTFQGAGNDRDDALDQLEDYLLENSGDFLRKFQRELIKSSPNDPTAGNPNSLQSQQVAMDFSQAGFDTGQITPIVGTSTDNKIFFGVSAGTFRAQGVSGKTITLPLSYTARFDSDPRYQLQFALPITYINQGGAKTGAASLSLGFQFPLTPVEAKSQWFLTPRVTVGGTGSIDAGAASILSNFSLTSRYVLDAGDLYITLANMAAYNFSIPFHVSDVHGDYKIKNLVFKNGLQIQKPLDFALFGSGRTSIMAGYAWTKFTGTDLYMNSYHDLSFSIGRFNDGTHSSMLRLGTTATFGKSFHKYVFNFGYTF